MSDAFDREVGAELLTRRENESEWLRLALASARMGTWEWNLQTGTVLWSDTLEEIHGRTPGLLGGTFADYLEILLPDDREVFQQAVRDALEQKSEFSVEFRIAWPDGSIHWIASKGRAFYDVADQPVRTVGLSMDITDRHVAAHELREAYRQNTAILESITDGFCALDSEWRVTSINPQGAHLLKRTPLQLLGRNLWEAFPEAIDTKFYREFHRAVSEHVPVYFEELYEPLNLWFEVRLFPIAEGGVTVIFQNITARKQSEDAMRESARLTALGADVGSALVEEETLPTMMNRCAEALVRHLDGAFARIWVLNEVEQMLELLASAGIYTHLDGAHSRVPVGSFKIGLIAQERQPHLTNEVVGDPRVGNQEWAQREGMVAFAGYPLIVEDRLIGVMAMFARHALTESTLDAMQTVAKQIALGIERKRAEAILQEQAAEVARLNTRLYRAMAESHHRIKNNLQVLSALVEMQILNSGGTISVGELTRLSQHIRTLASLHDLLTLESRSGTDNLDTVSLKAVLERLIPMLRAASGGKPIAVNAEQAKDARIPLREGSSFSLLVNELVSNAIKHGSGSIALTLELMEPESKQLAFARLEVCDDGPGFPVDFDPVKAANTGLELIESMGRWDLHGEILYENRAEGGARVVVTFPLNTTAIPIV